MASGSGSTCVLREDGVEDDEDELEDDVDDADDEQVLRLFWPVSISSLCAGTPRLFSKIWPGVVVVECSITSRLRALSQNGRNSSPL